MIGRSAIVVVQLDDGFSRDFLREKEIEGVELWPDSKIGIPIQCLISKWANISKTSSPSSCMSLQKSGPVH